MKEKLKTTTRRMIPVLAQIVQRYLPGYKIEELAAGEKIKARGFSYSAQVYLLMLGQLAHFFSPNELVDLSTIFSGELRRIRGIEAVKLTTFFGENQNAVEWQIWAAMLTHLVLRYIKWKNKVVSSYTRFAAIIKNTIWLKRSLEAVINFYCIAPGQSRPPPDESMPYLPGFERLAIA